MARARSADAAHALGQGRRVGGGGTGKAVHAPPPVSAHRSWCHVQTPAGHVATTTTPAVVHPPYRHPGAAGLAAQAVPALGSAAGHAASCGCRTSHAHLRAPIKQTHERSLAWQRSPAALHEAFGAGVCGHVPGVVAQGDPATGAPSFHPALVHVAVDRQ